MTFATGLKSILRQDPDVILVGEVRDVETARIAVQSALTGHLVFSSVHAIDAVSALYRLLDMGIEPFLITSAIVGVVAQRLVRRICSVVPRRRTSRPPTSSRSTRSSAAAEKTRFVHGEGCNFCSGTGYFERVGVYEVLRITDAHARAHRARTRCTPQLRKLAIEEGMQPPARRGAAPRRSTTSRPFPRSSAACTRSSEC